MQIQKYQNRISGPLLDRIDIHVEVLAIELKDLTESSIEEPSATIREQVTQASFIQRKRFSEQREVSCNAWSFWYGTRLRAAVRYKRATGAFLLGPTKAGNLAKTIRQHLEGVLA